eukprot:11292206-Heterocapsa_arctica.AAC.1
MLISVLLLGGVVVTVVVDLRGDGHCCDACPAPPQLKQYGPVDLDCVVDDDDGVAGLVQVRE